MNAASPPPRMCVQRLRPSPALAPFVEQYGLRDARLGASPIYTPLPARSDCFLEFYLADRYHIVDVASGAIHRAPRASLIGPHTRRIEDLLLTGTLRVFTIRFTAVGFRRLFGIPTRHLADSAEDAEVVLGPAVAELAESLAAASELVHLRAIAERFLLPRIPALSEPLSFRPIASIARSLARHSGAQDLARLAALHQLSLRQVERLFQEYVGLSPRSFGRLARLKSALELSRGSPAADWAGIAIAAGLLRPVAHGPRLSRSHRRIACPLRRPAQPGRGLHPKRGNCRPCRKRPIDAGAGQANVESMSRLAMVLLALTLAATGQAHSQTHSRTQEPAAMLSPADHQEIASVLDRFADAWKRRDMDAFATLFTEDCDWINIVGMHWKGKAQVVRAHHNLITTRYKGVDVHNISHEETEIAPGVALVIWVSSVDAYTSPEGQHRSTARRLAGRW